jgi:hypothetical protein
MCEIPTSFRIPKRYRRAFYFEERETGFAQWIIVEAGKLRVLSKGQSSPLGQSRCLDWCAESIAQIRGELEK